GATPTPGPRIYDRGTRIPIQVSVAAEHYNRVARMVDAGEKVNMTVDLAVEYQDTDLNGYNTVAEIPGTDKADELVMLGGHMDSWHSGTGATDNAIGSSIMLEAARLIQSLGLKPRRTIRVALWSGEEEGLLGSLAYVKQHFGTAENPKPEFAKLDCYFNVDTGTGRLLGAGVFGPPEAAAVLRPVLKLF